MSVNKMNVVNSQGLDTLLEEVFGTIGDNYLRQESIDQELDRISTNPVENRVIVETIDTKADKVEYYGFELDMDESDPSSMIRYFGVNSLYTPAHMDFTNNVFVYGDWEDAWFIKGLRPCILNQDGSVYCYLDPRNYAYRCTWYQDGTFTRGSSASTLITGSGTRNVMVGIPTVWIKVDTTISRKPRFYFAPTQLDSDYHAYAHTNADGDVVPYIYMAAYEGRILTVSTRSISSYAPTVEEPTEDQIDQARANNSNSDNIWDMQCLADRELITLLLLLIGRSTNAQTTFGFGNGSSYDASTGQYNLLNTGTMNDKGLFWGSSANNLGVKVFGIENFWGNAWKRCLGIIGVSGTIKYKLTKGTQDGSTATDYNTTGNGYLSAGSASAITSSQFISDMYVGKYGLIPCATGSGGTNLYYCDRVWNNSSLNNAVAVAGGASGNGYGAGPMCLSMLYAANLIHETFGSTISCKPHIS